MAVTSEETRQVVYDTLATQFGVVLTNYLVPLLNDEQIGKVVTAFPELTDLAASPRSRDLLRRPIVIDLLVRSGVSGVPLSDADAMNEVWSGLVRRHEQSDRGTPDAREMALLRLADQALTGDTALDTDGRIDPTALEGLRRDGLLRSSADDRYRIGPEFAHDEVRRYAVARLLLAQNAPASKLAQVGVPRWALAASRLACQALLALPATHNPMKGRFTKLQAAFDALVDAGHGERWGDVPGEALLTLGDPDPVLRDAWPVLRTDESSGFRRLARLVDQRLRKKSRLVNEVAVEPLINLLLDDEAPWGAGKHSQNMLRDWLRALVVACAPAGHPLRVRLRKRLVEASVAASQRLAEARQRAVAAWAARTPDEIAAEKRHRTFFVETGNSRRRRARPEVSRETTDRIFLELLALLGPDLGDDGAAILRHVAQNAPSKLAPSIEEFLTGQSLAAYQPGLLAELTEAYYLDDEADGFGFHEEGIRRHNARSFGIDPLFAWYRGPFMPLFQTDFQVGVAVLNRMLNHAALVRANTVMSLDHRGSTSEVDISVFQTELEITDARRKYVGDAHVWLWYRGTGVGPYPCVSALQALERVCDQILKDGVPLAAIVAALLAGCESLAMVGLVVGLLVRHSEKAGRLFDRYFAEPWIWHFEFVRVVAESSGLAGSARALVAQERRKWSMREAAATLVLQSDDARARELRAVGDALIANARRCFPSEAADVVPEGDDPVVDQLMTVRAWASSLDRDSYETHEVKDGWYIKSAPPEEVGRALEVENQAALRGLEAQRLMAQYGFSTKREISKSDLAADLGVARDLLESPPNAAYRWDGPAAVAAYALEAHLLFGEDLPRDGLTFAAETVFRIGDGEATPSHHEFEGTYFQMGAARSAARVLPLLILPSAQRIRIDVDGVDGSTSLKRAIEGGFNLAKAVATEVRLQLARGLDHLWASPCTAADCRHEVALKLALETMRDCVIGEWDRGENRRTILVLEDPVHDSLAKVANDSICTSRLDPALRALAPAAMANICVSIRARSLLMSLLAAQRRSLLASDQNLDQRGTHALVSARALLALAAEGDDSALREHLNAYADNSMLMGAFLKALSAAAEESTSRGETARRIWPDVVAHVLKLNESGQMPSRRDHYDDLALAALVPNTAGESSYFYLEVQNKPVVWWEPLALQSTIRDWLPVAEGNAGCVDQVIGFLRAISREDQVRTGLPWVATLVLADPPRVARGSYLLSSWLIEIRPSVEDSGLIDDWQRIVDALVVAGVSRLAPYSE